MMEPKRTLFRTENLRRALLLGVLIAAIIAIAVFISVRIYTQLDGAARVDADFVQSQKLLDEVVAVQLSQEAGLRGYVAWGTPFFLDSDMSGTQSDAYLQDLATFERTTRTLGVPELRASIEEMRSLHILWLRDVALPLRKRPHAPQALLRQTTGKVYIDQLRGEASAITAQLNAKLTDAQVELKRRINQALVGGLASILVFGIIAIVFVASRAQILEVLERETSIVETLQGAFRTDLDVLPQARLGTAYVSADRDAAVGGDLFDVRRLGATRGLVMIADISGKGIEAAVNTAFVKYSIRTLALTGSGPAEILAKFNRIFLDTVADPNLFVVTFVGILDIADDSLTYATAGHAGAWLRRGTEVDPLAVTGPIIGLDASFAFEERTLQLERGDSIVLATDGLTEARNVEGDVLEDAAAIELLRSASQDPQACADDLVAAVRARSGGSIHDDLALVVISYDGKARDALAREAA
jgi:serine phosphatase RsbU (regulator of sigma subunit)